METAAPSVAVTSPTDALYIPSRITEVRISRIRPPSGVVERTGSCEIGRRRLGADRLVTGISASHEESIVYGAGSYPCAIRV
jgi:hypothetical protein